MGEFECVYRKVYVCQLERALALKKNVYLTLSVTRAHTRTHTHTHTYAHALVKRTLVVFRGPYFISISRAPWYYHRRWRRATNARSP